MFASRTVPPTATDRQEFGCTAGEVGEVKKEFWFQCSPGELSHQRGRYGGDLPRRMCFRIQRRIRHGRGRYSAAWASYSEIRRLAYSLGDKKRMLSRAARCHRAHALITMGKAPKRRRSRRLHGWGTRG